MSTLKVSGGPGTEKVELDGADVGKALRGLSIVMKAGDLAKVELDAVVLDMSSELEGVAAHIPEASHALLVQLGWTPPPEE